MPAPRLQSPAAFTLIELLATIAIVAILLATVTAWVGNYITTARTTANTRTLAVLNDALTRYKTEGGNISALSPSATVGGILRALATPITWNGLTHQFIKDASRAEYLAHAPIGRGSGKTYRFIAYNGTELENVATNYSTTNFITTVLNTDPTDGYRDGPLAEALFNSPRGICFDSSGNLLVVDMLNGKIRKISPDNTVSTFVTGLGSPYQVEVTVGGRIFVSCSSNKVWEVFADGSKTLFADTPSLCAGVTADNAGNIYVSLCEGGQALYRYPASGGAPTVLLTGAPLSYPLGIVYDRVHNCVLITDSGKIVKYDVATGVFSTHISGGGFGLGRFIAIDYANDRLYTADGSHIAYAPLAAGGTFTIFATLPSVEGVAIGPDGSLYCGTGAHWNATNANKNGITKLSIK